MGLAKGMDPLGDIPSDDSDDDDDAEPGASSPAEAAPKKPAKTPLSVDYDTLIQHGMRSAPSIMGIKERDSAEDAWGWSKGQAGDSARDDMSSEALNRKTNAGLEAYCAGAIDDAAARRAARARARAERDAQIQRRRQRERDTREALRRDDRSNAREEDRSFKAREKRKRERGQQASGKDWVQEEKRALREAAGAGGGFGFD